jgi:alpha-ribazole phosphatase
MNKIYFFRHGKTIANDKKIFCGITESELLALEKNKKILFPETDVLFSSPLSRCAYYTTSVKLKKIIFDQNLTEINFGLWEGKTFEEIEKEYPQKAKKYLNDPVKFRFPEGESLDLIIKRVKYFLKNELTNYLSEGKNILIISHEGVIKAFIITLLNLKNEYFFKMKILNQTFTVFEYTVDKSKCIFNLTGLNIQNVPVTEE